MEFGSLMYFIEQKKQVFVYFFNEILESQLGSNLVWGGGSQIYWWNPERIEGIWWDFVEIKFILSTTFSMFIGGLITSKYVVY